MIPVIVGSGIRTMIRETVFVARTRAMGLKEATVAETRSEAVRHDRAAKGKPIAEEIGAFERLHGALTS